jgi:biotin operon repressor
MTTTKVSDTFDRVDHWPKIKEARQRLVLCRLMIDMMRTVHGAYAPASEPFGTRLETFYIALCVALGDIERKPFSVAKIAAYMHVPRTTVIRRLSQLQRWGLIDRREHRYYIHEKTLSSLIGMRSYRQARRILSEATRELTVLDALPD